MELNPVAIVGKTKDTWNGKLIDDLTRDELIAALQVMVKNYDSLKNAQHHVKAIPRNFMPGDVIGPFGYKPCATQLLSS